MKDHEIATKRLSDWKPEADPKLQKAFGKFVEEAGELVEEANRLVSCCFESYNPVPLENEMADCLAFIDVVGSTAGLTYFKSDFNDLQKLNDSKIIQPSRDQIVTAVSAISIWAGVSLAIVGRCQIQGLGKSHPETGKPNRQMLEDALGTLKHVILISGPLMKLNMDRIQARQQAKIDSKLPWVMGTATDLLPST